MGEDLENPIQYLNSLHEISWNEVFLRKFKSKVFRVRSCLYEKNRLTLVRSRQNGVFHFVKTNRLYEKEFMSPR